MSKSIVLLLMVGMKSLSVTDDDEGLKKKMMMMKEGLIKT